MGEMRNKDKLVPVIFLTQHQAMKTYWGSGGIAPRIPDLGTTWRAVVNFTPRPLYLQGKNPWYPLDRRLGGPQSRSGCSAEEKSSQTLLGLESPNIQPVAQCYTTELSELRTQFWEGRPLRRGPVMMGSCEHGNEPSNSIKVGEFLD
jgi:hypothetical protein